MIKRCPARAQTQTIMHATNSLTSAIGGGFSRFNLLLPPAGRLVAADTPDPVDDTDSADTGDAAATAAAVDSLAKLLTLAIILLLCNTPAIDGNRDNTGGDGITAPPNRNDWPATDLTIIGVIIFIITLLLIIFIYFFAFTTTSHCIFEAIRPTTPSANLLIQCVVVC
jgi:hypothetical protein